MTPPLVDYLVARAGLPPGSGLAYDYVVGGDGVFIVAANPLLELRVPVAVCDIVAWLRCLLPARLFTAPFRAPSGMTL